MFGYVKKKKYVSNIIYLYLIIIYLRNKKVVIVVNTGTDNKIITIAHR